MIPTYFHSIRFYIVWIGPTQNRINQLLLTDLFERISIRWYQFRNSKVNPCLVVLGVQTLVYCYKSTEINVNEFAATCCVRLEPVYSFLNVVD